MDQIEVDLINLIENDLGPGRRHGRWVVHRCPFHHPDEHPSFAVTNGDGRRGAHWRCFSAACGRHGEPVGWMMEYHHMSKSEALDSLADHGARISRLNRIDDQLVKLDYPPGATWQERAWEVIGGAETALWDERGTGEALRWPEVDPKTGAVVDRELSPLDWLLSRGLTEATLRFWHIGFIPRSWGEDPIRWGLEGKPVYFSQGILIPCFFGKTVWYLKIRRPMAKPNKYLHIRGGKPALFMAQTLEWQDAIVFCEGELDALLLWQEAQDLAGVATLGSAGGDLNASTWGLYLIHSKRRFTAYDADKAGEQGGDKLAWFHPRRLTVPQVNPFDKDLTDYFRSGGDLREWLQRGMAEVSQGQNAKEITAW